MDDSRMVALEQQVSKLQSSNRRMRGLGMIAVAVGAVGLFTAEKPDKNIDCDTVTSNQYWVRGKKDKYRATFGVDDKGTFPQMTLLDNKERLRLLIGLAKDGSPEIVFYDKDGNVQKTIDGSSK